MLPQAAAPLFCRRQHSPTFKGGRAAVSSAFDRLWRVGNGSAGTFVGCNFFSPRVKHHGVIAK